MRFISMVKSAESAGMPPQSLMEAIGKLAEEAFANGTMVEMGGLGPSAMGARVRLAQGQVAVIDGPFSEAKELVGGYAILDVASKAEAVEAARQFIALHHEHWPGWEGEAELRQIVAP